MAAKSYPLTEHVSYDLSDRVDRQEIVDSVLGTMGAEGEPPSDEARALMQKFVEGDITLDEMSNSILAHAARIVNESHSLRLPVR